MQRKIVKGVRASAEAWRELERSNPLPLWAQLLGELRRRLDDGEFVDAFPTDLELSSSYGVSRSTVREALRHLQEDGVVLRGRGRRTSLNVPTPEFMQPTGVLYSLFQEIESSGVPQESKVLNLVMVQDQAIASKLSLGSDATLVYLERLRMAGGTPLALDRTWLDAQVALPLLESDLSHTSLYQELAERCGISIVGGSESIRAILPCKEDTLLLQMRPGQAVFEIERSTRDANRAVEWRVSLVRGDRYAFLANWEERAYASAAASQLRMVSSEIVDET